MASSTYPLKKSSHYREVSLNGTKKRLSSWLTLQLMPSVDTHNYYGITASRKVAGAVIRNKLKRWVRNCVRTEKWPEKYNAYVFVFVFRPQTDKQFFTNKSYKEFCEAYKKI